MHEGESVVMDWRDSVFTVLFLFINTFTILNIWMLLTVFFGCDLRLTKKNILCSCGLFLAFDMVISLIFYPFENQLENVQTLLCFLFIAVGAFCLAKEKRVKALLFSLPALVLYVVYGSILEMLDVLLGLEGFTLEYDRYALTPLCAMSDIILFFILFFVLRKCRREKWNLALNVGEGIGVLTFSMLFFALKTIFESITEVNGISFYRKFGYVVLIIINLGILYAIIHRKLAGYYKNISQNYKERFEEEYSYFQAYKDRQQDTAQFRHDWQNHMLVLQEMLREGDYGKAEEYFEGLSGLSGTVMQKILTGNEILDMLLGIKEEECRKEKIAISMEGTLSGLTGLKPVDACILFSNLLDNAIEANRKVKTGRFIKIRARTVHEVMYLEMENPMEGELQYEGSRIVTTKENSEAHGLGLKNIMEIVEKHGGQYHIEGKGKLFTIQIIFPLDKEAKKEGCSL